MSFVDVAGRYLHYRTAGDGVGLLLVHGYMGSSLGWRHQLAAFADRFRVVAPDLWGHGESEPSADPLEYGIDRVVADALAVLEAETLSRFHLVGHSLGGAVAQEIALRDPARVGSLVLANTTDGFGDHDAGAGPLLERIPDTEERKMLEALGPEVLTRTWDALLGWAGTTTRASAITVPTLVLHSALDAPKIVEGSRRLTAHIRGAQLVEIAHAGHSPHLEQPQEWNRIVRSFIDGS